MNLTKNINKLKDVYVNLKLKFLHNQRKILCEKEM